MTILELIQLLAYYPLFDHEHLHNLKFRVLVLHTRPIERLQEVSQLFPCVLDQLHRHRFLTL
jgi:hypothetical protein